MPLQRRVAYLTTVAVALAVAATSVAGYVTLRVSLYRALDTELVTTAAALARGPVVEDLRTIGNLTGRSVRSDDLAIAVRPGRRQHLLRARRAATGWCWDRKSWPSRGWAGGSPPGRGSPRPGSSTASSAVPLSEVGAATPW